MRGAFTGGRFTSGGAVFLGVREPRKIDDAKVVDLRRRQKYNRDPEITPVAVGEYAGDTGERVLNIWIVTPKGRDVVDCCRNSCDVPRK